MQKSISLLILAAAAVSLTSGCRTMNRRNKNANEIAPAPATVDTPAAAVGASGSYKEFVIPDDGGDKTYAIESDGLRGSTGRHVSAPAPAPEPKPVVPAAPAGSGYYVVQEGDILGRIANKHGTTVKAIVEANGIKDASKIRVGQKLKIPAASPKTASASSKTTSAKPAPSKKSATLPAKDGCTVYVVQNGDILGRIAKKNGVTMKSIREANGMDNDKLYAGKAIYIPVAAKAAEQPAAAEEVKPAAPASEEIASPVVPETKPVTVPETKPVLPETKPAVPEVKPVEVPVAAPAPAPVTPVDVEPAEDFLSTLD